MIDTGEQPAQPVSSRANSLPRIGSTRPLPDNGTPIELSQLSERRRGRRHVRVMGVCCDFVAISLALLIATIIRFGTPFHPQPLNIAAVLLPVYLGIGLNNGIFGLEALSRAISGSRSATLAFLTTISVVGLVIFFLKVSTDFSRVVFGTGAVISLILLPLFRFVLSSNIRRMFGDTSLNEVIIEDGVRVTALPGVMVLDVERHGLAPRLNDPVMLDKLGRYLENADRVIVACEPHRRALWAMTLKGADVHAEVFAEELNALGPIALRRHNGVSTLVIATGPLGLADRVIKRLLDLILACVLLVFASPILMAIALAIRLDSRGPVFFTQERVGLGNRIFRMHKFRSMFVEQSDENGDRSTSRTDDRITRVGRFIRRTSLDELPQLVNVLSGAMSIVGPRPHALGSTAEDLLFWDIDSSYGHRHAVKPGMTGLAQVRGYRGATEKTLDLKNRLQADLEYLSGWSIWRDISIILATFRVMSHKNSY